MGFNSGFEGLKRVYLISCTQEYLRLVCSGVSAFGCKCSRYCSKRPAQGTIVRSQGRHQIVRVKNGCWHAEMKGGTVVECRSIKRAVLMKLSSLCCLEGRMICCLAVLVWEGWYWGFSVTRCRENTVTFWVQHNWSSEIHRLQVTD